MENLIPQGDSRNPVPTGPTSGGEEWIGEDLLPLGNKELPKTDGILAGWLISFGTVVAGYGLLLKKKRN